MVHNFPMFAPPYVQKGDSSKGILGMILKTNRHPMKLQPHHRHYSIRYMKVLISIHALSKCIMFLRGNKFDVEIFHNDSRPILTHVELNVCHKMDIIYDKGYFQMDHPTAYQSWWKSAQVFHHTNFHFLEVRGQWVDSNICGFGSHCLRSRNIRRGGLEMTLNLDKYEKGLIHLLMVMKVVKYKLNDQGRSLKEMVGYVDS